MSLILRKQCQDVLDTFGLSTYHIQICENRKHLQIVGECGQPLVDIYGIRFTRLVPSVAEITYAGELFDEFLGIHGKLIQSYVAKAKTFKALKSVKPSNDFVRIDTGTDYNRNTGNHDVIGYDFIIADSIADFKYKADKHGNQVKFLNGRVDPTSKITLATLSKFKADPTLLTKAKKYLKSYIAYRQTETELEQLKDKLSKCNV